MLTTSSEFEATAGTGTILNNIHCTLGTNDTFSTWLELIRLKAESLKLTSSFAESLQWVLEGFKTTTIIKSY
jgi:hypothetical protein